MKKSLSESGIFDWTPEEQAIARRRVLIKRNKIISLILLAGIAIAVMFML